MAAIDLLAGLGLTHRPLSSADVAGGMALSAESGWNQDDDDWRYLIAHAIGWGAEDGDGRLVATAMALPYGDRLAWLCMVLVTEDWRRRGIATALLAEVSDAAEALGLIPGLDATEAGQSVYPALGFCDVYPVTRWSRAAADGAPPQPGKPRIRPMDDADMHGIAALDRTAFGADRAALLVHLFARAPRFVWVADDDGALKGYCLGRNGRTADQLGPVVAADEDTAIALCAQALARPESGRRPLYIDVPDRHRRLAAWLQDAGFTAERGYMRMLKGRTEPVDDPAKIFALAGPEFG